MNDLRFALRQLLKNPGFTAVAVITLALGIGANTAIFSVINAVLLRPLPFKQPEQLVWVGGWNREVTQDAGVTPADFLDYQRQSQSFDGLAAGISGGISMTLTGNGEAEKLTGASVTFNYLDLFGVRPGLGRTFTAAEEKGGSDQVAVLSHGLWQRRFGADPSIINQNIVIDGTSLTVLGVMPPEFQYPSGVQLWKPMRLGGPPDSPFQSRAFHFLRPVGRLKQGVTLAQAQEEVNSIARQLENLHPKTNTNWSLFLFRLQDQLVANVRWTLLVLFGAVGLVLLIGCVNVANLLLVRATARTREIAVRLALGATGGRVVRQLLMESLLLATLGAGAGLLVARWAVNLFRLVGTGHLPPTATIGLSLPVLGFTVLATVLTGLFFGLLPALQTVRVDLAATLKDGGRSGGGSSRHRLLGLLAGAEMAGAVVLLIGAGLLLGSLLRLQRLGLGFDERNLLTARIDLPQPYQQPEKKVAFFEQVSRLIADLPGVETVGIVTELPLSGQSADTRFDIEGQAVGVAGPRGNADFRGINHQYLKAMKIPTLRGRLPTEAEVHDTAKVVVVSDTLARRYFPGEDPLGRRLQVESLGREPYEIIGVVGEVRHRGLGVEFRPTLYVPTLQIGGVNLVVRTKADPAGLMASVRQEIAAIDPSQPVADVKTMQERVLAAAAQPRLRTWLLGSFAITALALAALGVYGVMAFNVAQRRWEIGLRLALGATRRDVFKLTLGHGLRLTLAGLAVGLVGAIALTRVLNSLLYGIRSTDPIIFGGASLILVAVAMLASWLPALRASRVDPVMALRSE